jgi:hypothetical protein
MRLAAVLLWTVAHAAAQVSGIDGKSIDPFASTAKLRVFLFARSDCPLTNRYAPEVRRIADAFAAQGVKFFVVYPDPSESTKHIRAHMTDYSLPGVALRDPQHLLVRRAEATVSPQAAVFDATGKLLYTGRIDDRFVDFGKERRSATTHDLEAAITNALAGKPISPAKTKAVGCYLADVK